MAWSSSCCLSILTSCAVVASPVFSNGESPGTLKSAPYTAHSELTQLNWDLERLRSSTAPSSTLGLAQMGK
uniref:Uncharacterized protein n=1 Tax=Anguilla anguilla TaxID=7936 RepID=A0A0E9WBN9_ANGAN